VIAYASTSGFAHALVTIAICLLLVVLELFATALIVAPRAVIRKLVTLLRAVAARMAGATARASYAWGHNLSRRHRSG
jgi:hypothetical protein